jgi:hypothetical protein
VTDIVVATLAIVVLFNLLKLAESQRLAGAAGAVQTTLSHILDPGRALVPWPPGGAP